MSFTRSEFEEAERRGKLEMEIERLKAINAELLAACEAAISMIGACEWEEKELLKIEAAIANAQQGD